MAGGSIFNCMLAAALFWACNAVQITQFVQKSPMWQTLDNNYYEQLVPTSIENEWLNIKMNSKELEYAATYLKAAFWIVFTLPMVEMAWVLSKRGTRSLGCNVGIAVFTLAGSWSKWFTTILWSGMYFSFLELAKNFNLDNWLTPQLANIFGVDEDGIGWSVLEVNYVAFRGVTLVVDSVEWICLAVIFVLTFISVLEWRKEDVTTFGGKWNALGLFLGILSLSQFILEIVGVTAVGGAWIFFILYAALFRLLLFPLWILIMGFQLARASSKELDSIDTHQLSELELLSNQQGTAAQFTIDEDDDLNDIPLDGVPRAPSSPPAEAFASIDKKE